jgi:hypothetical protein
VQYAQGRWEGRREGTATQTEDEVDDGVLLDVVVGERAGVLELLAGVDEPLLVHGDAWTATNQ